MRVNGMMATIKMMNGMERPALTMAPKMLLMNLLASIWPLEVTTKITPKGIPIIMEAIVEMTVICRVSPTP